MQDVNLQVFRKKLSFGHFSAAIHVLSSNGIAPSNDATLADLQQKHPYAQPLTLPPDPISAASVSVNTNGVLNAIKKVFLKALLAAGTVYVHDIS